MFLLDLMLQNAGLGARSICASFRFQAPNGYERMYAPVANPSFVPCDLFDHRSGSPEVGLEACQETSKTCRRYSNDVVVHAIQHQSFSDNRGIRTEVPAPKAITKHHDGPILSPSWCLVMAFGAGTSVLI